MSTDISSMLGMVGGRVADPSLAGELPANQWYQCVSLIKEYLRRNYAMNPGKWGNAIDYWNNPAAPILDQFYRVHDTNAISGDIVVVVGLPGNPYGHIGIATGNNDFLNVQILEQNGATGGGTGTGGDAIRTRSIPRSRIAGLLRPKSPVPNLPPQPSIDCPTLGEVRYAFLLAYNTEPSQADIDGWVSGANGETEKLLGTLYTQNEWFRKNATIGAIATRDNWQGQIADLLLKVDAFSQNPTKSELENVKQQLTTCKENLRVTDEQLQAFRTKDAADAAAADSFLTKLGKFIKRFIP